MCNDALRRMPGDLRVYADKYADLRGGEGKAFVCRYIADRIERALAASAQPDAQVPEGWCIQHVPDGFIRIDAPDGRSVSVARGPDVITSTTYDFVSHFAAEPQPTEQEGQR